MPESDLVEPVADPRAAPVDPALASSAAADGPSADDLGYRVQLEGFSGPLDLLLFLVRKAEVDVHDIPIATIADQFIATVRAWEDLDLDLAGDFILMAATLLEIKARAVVPPEIGAEIVDDGESEFIDPRADLIQQLLAFRQCKDWADALQGAEDAFARVHHRRTAEELPEAPAEEDGIDLTNADPYQLFAVWEKILGDISGKGPRTVIYDDIPIEDRVRQLSAALRAAGEGRLSWLLGSVETRIQRVGVVVALLECVRKRTIEVIQHEQYQDIQLYWRGENPPPPAPLPQLDSATPDDAGPKRRKRLELITYHHPVEGGVQEILPEVEEVLVSETEEDRFRKELNQATGVDNALERVKDLHSGLLEHLILRGIALGPLPAGAVVETVAPLELPPEETAAKVETTATAETPG